MTLIIFPAAFVLLWGFFVLKRTPGDCWRQAFLNAATAIGVLIVFSSEGLSAFRLMNTTALAMFWLIISGICFAAVRGRIALLTEAATGRIVKIKQILREDRASCFFFFACLVNLLFVAVTAFFAPPNTWDSLVYHMSRVMHWAQNGSIEHFPTNIKTQIFYAPFAEWMILHLQILSGSDRWANFVQWFAMAGCAVTGSLFARSWGLESRAQIFSALAVLTMPMLILQGSSTQNDLLAAFWVFVFVYRGWQALSTGSKEEIVWAGAALGLATLTKATAAIVALGFVLWFIVLGVHRHKTKILGPLIIAAILALSLNLNHWTRNASVTGHILGDPDVFRVTTTEGMSPRLFVSNALRHLGLHLGTSVRSFNEMTGYVIARAHEAMGLRMNEPLISMDDQILKVQTTTHEDLAGQFVQVVLIVFAVILFFSRKLWLKIPGLSWYLTAWVFSAVMFVLLLKWQPFATRLHLPLFVLIIPWSASVLLLSLGRRWGIVLLIGMLLFSTSVPYVFRNGTRKIYSKKRTVFSVSRLEQYFTSDRTLWEPYQNATDFLADQDCRAIGLRTGDNYWEYPFWVLLKMKIGEDLRVEHVDLKGKGPDRYVLGEFTPCAVINFGRALEDNHWLKISGEKWRLVWDDPRIKIYAPR